ncbi:MAG: HIT family protein [Solirubrobacterales bacterium]
MSPPVETECDFCRIASGADQSVAVVCEGHDWVAFFPLEPATPGHTLVIPRLHVADLWEAELQLASELMEAAVQVGRAIFKALSPEGMNLITSAGAAAEQTIFHLHLHVVPRWRRDEFGPIWPTEARFEDASIDRVAERIREACQVE